MRSSQSVEERLDAARRLRLERDRWAIRLPELRAYRDAMSGPLQRFTRLRTALEDIKGAGRFGTGRPRRDSEGRRGDPESRATRSIRRMNCGICTAW